LSFQAFPKKKQQNFELVKNLCLTMSDGARGSSEATLLGVNYGGCLSAFQINYRDYPAKVMHKLDKKRSVSFSMGNEAIFHNNESNWNLNFVWKIESTYLLAHCKRTFSQHILMLCIPLIHSSD
jgi:hypothetical protein